MNNTNFLKEAISMDYEKNKTTRFYIFFYFLSVLLFTFNSCSFSDAPTKPAVTPPNIPAAPGELTVYEAKNVNNLVSNCL